MTKQAAKPTRADKVAASSKPAAKTAAKTEVKPVPVPLEKESDNHAEQYVQQSKIKELPQPERNEDGSEVGKPAPDSISNHQGEMSKAVNAIGELAKVLKPIAEQAEKEYEGRPLHKLEQAYVLPEVDSAASPRKATAKHAEFFSFKDQDGRTMNIVVMSNGELGKHEAKQKK